jgi:RNA polymerase sigma factor (sigma-70 family)
MHAARETRDLSFTDGRVSDAWRTERAYLLGVASRMLHTAAGAEDVIQEAFGRLARADVAEIEDVRGWLMVVVRRLCLDEMNSAHSRRDSTPGWLAEGDVPIDGQQPMDPADRITLDDEVQLALALVLDRLTPPERTAFVLHDVFRASHSMPSATSSGELPLRAANSRAGQERESKPVNLPAAPTSKSHSSASWPNGSSQRAPAATSATSCVP